jgi:HAMP domain-containing protein
MTATASTELFFADEGALPRITSEELPQKLQDDPFSAPQHEGITLTPAATVLLSVLATTPSKAGSVQVDDPASCSGLGSAPCGVRSSPNDPGSFVQSIAELLRQLALTGSSALDLLKLALILAIVGAFAIWGTRRRPTSSVVETRRTLRSGDLLHRHHRAVANGSDRSDEWITVPHAIVRQRPTWRVPLAQPRFEAATSGGSVAHRKGGSSFVAGSAARLSICPTTTDRSAPALVLTHRGNGR